MMTNILYHFLFSFCSLSSHGIRLTPEFQKNFSKFSARLSPRASKAELLKSALKITSDRPYAFPRHVLLRETLKIARDNYSLEELE